MLHRRDEGHRRSGQVQGDLDRVPPRRDRQGLYILERLRRLAQSIIIEQGQGSAFIYFAF